MGRPVFSAVLSPQSPAYRQRCHPAQTRLRFLHVKEPRALAPARPETRSVRNESSLQAALSSWERDMRIYSSQKSTARASWVLWAQPSNEPRCKLTHFHDRRRLCSCLSGNSKSRPSQFDPSKQTPPGKVRTARESGVRGANSPASSIAGRRAALGPLSARLFPHLISSRGQTNAHQ